MTTFFFSFLHNVFHEEAIFLSLVLQSAQSDANYKKQIHIVPHFLKTGRRKRGVSLFMPQRNVQIFSIFRSMRFKVTFLTDSCSFICLHTSNKHVITEINSINQQNGSATHCSITFTIFILCALLVHSWSPGLFFLYCLNSVPVTAEVTAPSTLLELVG